MGCNCIGDRMREREFYNNAYFIENHSISSKVTISLTCQKSYLIKELKKLKEQLYEINEQKETYVCSLYRFEYDYTEIKRNYDELIILQLKDGKEIIFEYYIPCKELYKNTFIYDIEFKKKGIIFSDYYPKSIKLTHEAQDNILINYLTEQVKSHYFYEFNKNGQLRFGQYHIIKKLLEHLSDFFPEEIDILEEKYYNNKYILFKYLLEEGILTNEDFDSLLYIQNVKSVTKKLQSKILSGNIEWSKLDFSMKSEFFYKKLLKIFLNNSNKADEAESYINKCYLSKMKIIGKLDKIQEFFLIFFNKAEENNINEIKKHKEKLLFGNINYYVNNKITIDDLIKKYELIAKKFLNEFKSAFNKKIYESNKIKFINENESYWLDKTENDFNELKNAIIVNDFNNLNEYILNICSDTIKDKNEKELKKEIDILIQIFDINNIKKNNLNNSLNNFFNFIEIKYIIPKANEEISHKKEFIGEGGFGHVYLIQYYQKKYALKEINLKLLNE